MASKVSEYSNFQALSHSQDVASPASPSAPYSRVPAARTDKDKKKKKKDKRQERQEKENALAVKSLQGPNGPQIVEAGESFADNASGNDDTNDEDSDHDEQERKILLGQGTDARQDPELVKKAWKSTPAAEKYKGVYQLIQENWGADDDDWDSEVITPIEKLNKELAKLKTKNNVNVEFPVAELNIHRADILTHLNYVANSETKSERLQAIEGFFKACNNFIELFEAYGIPYKELYGDDTRDMITDLCKEQFKPGAAVTDNARKLIGFMYGPYKYNNATVAEVTKAVIEVSKAITENDQKYQYTPELTKLKVLVRQLKRIDDPEWSKKLEGMVSGISTIAKGKNAEKNRGIFMNKVLDGISYLAESESALVKTVNDYCKYFGSDNTRVIWPPGTRKLEQGQFRIDAGSKPSNSTVPRGSAPRNDMTAERVDEDGDTAMTIESGVNLDDTNISGELSQYDDHPIKALVNSETGRTHLGRLEAVRNAGRSYKVLVNAGTDKKRFLKLLSGGEFGAQVCADLQEKKRTMDGPEMALATPEQVRRGKVPKSALTHNDISLIHRCVSMNIEDHIPGETNPLVKAPTYFEVEWKNGEHNWLTLSELSKMVGKRYAEVNFLDPCVRKNIRNEIFFTKCRIEGVHPDTLKRLAQEDKENTPWLLPRPAEDEELLERRQRQLAVLEGRRAPHKVTTQAPRERMEKKGKYERNYESDIRTRRALSKGYEDDMASESDESSDSSTDSEDEREYRRKLRRKSARKAWKKHA